MLALCLGLVAGLSDDGLDVLTNGWSFLHCLRSSASRVGAIPATPPDAGKD